MKLLLIYGTTEGQTRKIFQYLKELSDQQGNKADIFDATGDLPNPDAYDAIIIGGSLHMQKYQSSVKHYIMDHVDELNKKRSAFVSVSLAAASHDNESHNELVEITHKFLDHTGWKPKVVEQIAGALKFTKYNWLKKFIMRLISKKEGGDTNTSEDYEYTDWSQVDKFLNKVTASVQSMT